MRVKKIISPIIYMALAVCYIMALSSCSSVTNSNETSHVRVGITSIHDFGFGQLEMIANDLKEQLNVEVEFVELITGRMSPDEFAHSIDEALALNKIDMVIGIPSFFASTWIANERLLDITDYVAGLENIHRGVVNISKTMGNGRMYFISPVIDDIYLLFFNRTALDELGVGSDLPSHISWADLLERLYASQTAIVANNSELFPIAISVGSLDNNFNLVSQFLMQSAGLGSHLVEGYQLTQPMRELFAIYAEVTARYGRTDSELRNGFLPHNLIFAEGNHLFLVGNIRDLELMLNEEANRSFNLAAITAEERVIVGIPSIGVSVINFDGSRKQNIRETAIFINRNTEHKETAINIMNLFMSKEYAHRIIENRMLASVFSTHRFVFPSYFDDETIAQLNGFFSGNFDAALFYDVDYGNAIMGMYINDMDFMNLLSEAFAYVHENFTPDDDIDGIVSTALMSMEESLQLIINYHYHENATSNDEHLGTSSTYYYLEWHGNTCSNEA